MAHAAAAAIWKQENPFFEGKDDHDAEGKASSGAPEPEANKADQPEFRVPPRTAVGGVLISTIGRMNGLEENNNAYLSHAGTWDQV